MRLDVALSSLYPLAKKDNFEKEQAVLRVVTNNFGNCGLFDITHDNDEELFSLYIIDNDSDVNLNELEAYKVDDKEYRHVPKNLLERAFFDARIDRYEIFRD